MLREPQDIGAVIPRVASFQLQRRRLCLRVNLAKLPQRVLHGYTHVPRALSFAQAAAALIRPRRER
jgi:hypothetical protein